MHHKQQKGMKCQCESFQVRDSPPIHSVLITGDRIRAFSHGGGSGEVQQRTVAEGGDTTAGGGGEETEQEEVSGEEEEQEGDESGTAATAAEDPVNIKLRFLDDSELDVTTKLSECLKKFRRRHLDSHLSLSPTDKVNFEAIITQDFLSTF